MQLGKPHGRRAAAAVVLLPGSVRTAWWAALLVASPVDVDQIGDKGEQARTLRRPAACGGGAWSYRTTLQQRRDRRLGPDAQSGCACVRATATALYGNGRLPNFVSGAYGPS